MLALLVPLLAFQINTQSGNFSTLGFQSLNATSLLCSKTAPTIGTGAGASIQNANGTCAFQVNVGTGGALSTIVIALPTSATGWHCEVVDPTTKSTSVFITMESAASTATSCTITNYSDVAVVGPWAASDVLDVSAFAR